MNIFSKIKKIIINKNVVCYYRCSKKSRREHLRQKFLCEKYAEKNGYEIVEEFAEIISGNSKLDERTAMLNCITYCIKNKINTIIISEVDRFSRNAQTAKDILSMVKPFGIKFIILDNNIDTSKSQKQIDKLINIVEMSHYELKKIEYRLQTGRERYKINGGNFGRKKGTIKSKEKKREEYEEVLKLLFEEDGYSIRKIAELTNVGTSTVMRLKNEFKDEYSNVSFAEPTLTI